MGKRAMHATGVHTGRSDTCTSREKCLGISPFPFLGRAATPCCWRQPADAPIGGPWDERPTVCWRRATFFLVETHAQLECCGGGHWIADSQNVGGAAWGSRWDWICTREEGGEASAATGGGHGMGRVGQPRARARGDTRSTTGPRDHEPASFSPT